MGFQSAVKCMAPAGRAHAEPAGSTGRAPFPTRSPTMAGGAHGPGRTPNLERLEGTGRPLPASERAFFEPRFGRDLSHVQVHADGRAADTARSLGARAFALGRHIIMGAGEYRPGSDTGRRLLGHELTHVLQQAGASAGADPLRVSDPREPAERNAADASSALMRGETPVVTRLSELVVARDVRDAGVPDAGVPTDAGVGYANRGRQVGCVARLGGCSSTRPAGIPTQAEIRRYNAACRKSSGYSGPDITPTSDECRQYRTGEPVDPSKLRELQGLLHEYAKLKAAGRIRSEDAAAVDRMIRNVEASIRGDGKLRGIASSTSGKLAGSLILFAGGLTADDVTVFGIADDVLIPFVLIGAGLLGMVALLQGLPDPVVDTRVSQEVGKTIEAVRRANSRKTPQPRSKPRKTVDATPPVQEPQPRRRRRRASAYPLCWPLNLPPPLRVGFLRTKSPDRDYSGVNQRVLQAKWIRQHGDPDFRAKAYHVHHVVPLFLGGSDDLRPVSKGGNGILWNATLHLKGHSWLQHQPQMQSPPHPLKPLPTNIYRHPVGTPYCFAGIKASRDDACAATC